MGPVSGLGSLVFRTTLEESMSDLGDEWERTMLFMEQCKRRRARERKEDLIGVVVLALLGVALLVVVFSGAGLQ